MKYDIIIIGAGIVGLATAFQLKEKNPNLKLLILEKEDDICKHQTGNNSGVIHSGIYYKPGSLKAINCKKGYNQLLSFCDKNKVQYEICGKIIIAVKVSELEKLDDLFNRGKENGLENLRMLSKEQLNEIEPYAAGLGGIFVPQTGIIDFEDISRKYLEIVLQKNGQIEYNQKVKEIITHNDFIEVITQDKSYQTKFLVTCAGLQSDRIAKLTNPKIPLKIIPFRGEYYKLKEAKRYLVKSLIYPVPDPAFPFLGVHFTRMLNGEVEAGPNAVLAFKREGYKKTSFNLKDTFDTFTFKGFLRVIFKYWKMGIGEFYRSYNKNAFVKALRKLLPEINKNDLIKGGAGVRAQACDNKGGLLDDFYFVENKNIIHVCNAPSPAATASLSIGEFIADKILKSFD